MRQDIDGFKLAAAREATLMQWVFIESGRVIGSGVCVLFLDLSWSFAADSATMRLWRDQAYMK